LELLNRISSGEAQMSDLDKLLELARTVKETALCGLGQTAPNPVLTTLRYFRHEYEEHVLLGHCRAARCEGLVLSPCRHACPAGVNAAEYIGLAGEGRYTEAVDVVRLRNPFVSVCGRVCDHPCETFCRRGELDEPVAIRALKRFAEEQAKDHRRLLAPPVKGEPEVAIVGSGPAGLSCAYFLALFGRKSVVFEQHPVPGGLLALGIPEYRLPREALQRDIDYILAYGVELRTDTPVSDLDELRRAYKAVFVAVGAQADRRLGVPGEELEGVVHALSWLRNRALGRQVPCGQDVAVIGGGNAAIDAARTALRLGAGRVTVLYRRTRSEMPAYEEEIEQALDEGVEIMELVAPIEFLGDGRLSAIRLVRMQLGAAEADGRRRPIPMTGSEFLLKCDMAIIAIGQAVTGEAVGEISAQLLDRGVFKVDPVTLATSLPGVYAGGDCVRGGGSVIEAIADGQRAAVAIDRALGGLGDLPRTGGFSFRSAWADEVATVGRARERELPPVQRVGGFEEVLRGLDIEAAFTEARRCLRCDLERRQSLLSRMRGAAATQATP
ncbi:MAG: FAD-dependent oxidoreductase, partial [Armatimonadetes bacterium]|nr:FAD-dependent oxidoreductase [Armatimonadota bacterium]